MTSSAVVSIVKFLLSQGEIEKLVLPQDERRSNSRFSDLVTIRIAPMLGDELPRLESFQDVVGRDISQSGVSFFLSTMPYFEDLEIELSQGENVICVMAEVVNSKPVAGLEPYHLVSCRFTGTVAPR